MIDSSVVRARQHAAGVKGEQYLQNLGRPRGDSFENSYVDR